MTELDTDDPLEGFEDDMEDDFRGAAFDPDMLGALDGAVADAFAKRKARLTSVLLNGETGVIYESLALFAEPLFELYELDPAEAFQLRDNPDAVGDDIVALIETARVLWAFLSLPRTERGHMRGVLASQLVGEDATEDDWVDLDGLIEAAEIHWKALLPEEIAAAESSEHETLDFENLILHPAFRIGSEPDEAAHTGFGPTGLSEIEARALFAQPLLDDPSTMSDGDAFEDAIALADAFWSLAQNAVGDPATAVQAFAATHAADPEGAKQMEADAKMMVERFRTLFPERAK